MFLLVFQQLTDKMSPHSPTHLDCRSACSVRVCVTTLKEQRNVQQQETQAALTLALNIFLIKLRRFLFQTTETRRRILLLWFLFSLLEGAAAAALMRRSSSGFCLSLPSVPCLETADEICIERREALKTIKPTAVWSTPGPAGEGV